MKHKRFEDAAYSVLKEKRRPMRCQEIIDEVMSRSLWSRREGAKPQSLFNSLYGTLIKATQKNDTKIAREDNTDVFYTVSRNRIANGNKQVTRKTKEKPPLRSHSTRTRIEEFFEGDTKEITLEMLRRDQRLKKSAISRYGLNCQVCGFNFR